MKDAEYQAEMKRLGEWMDAAYEAEIDALRQRFDSLRYGGPRWEAAKALAAIWLPDDDEGA